MQRQWIDQRDGKAYQVEVEQSGSVQKKRTAGAEPPWRLWFHSADDPNVEIASDAGLRLSELPDRELQRMLDEARGWATVDVDEEMVTFFVHPAGTPMETPPDAPLPAGRPRRLVLSGRGSRSAAMLADPSPKNRIEEFDAEDLRTLWRGWVSS